MDKRKNKLAVFLDDAEIGTLDFARGGMSRARVIRLLLSAGLPAPIPAINIKLHSDLGRALGKGRFIIVNSYVLHVWRRFMKVLKQDWNR